MGRYRIVVRRSVAKDLRRIPNRDVRRILATIESLSVAKGTVPFSSTTASPRCPRKLGQSPVGAEKLSGMDKYRVRSGDYRLLYEIHDDEVIVVVVKVGHRRDVYRRK